MNWKRFVLASLAVVLLAAACEFVLHVIVLRDLYMQTAALWRPEAEMQALQWLMGVSYVIFAPVLVYIYSRGYEAGKPGLGQGLRYGFWVGLLLNVPMALACYAVMPIPATLAAGWFVGGMVEMLLLGGVIGAIWKK